MSDYSARRAQPEKVTYNEVFQRQTDLKRARMAAVGGGAGGAGGQGSGSGSGVEAKDVKKEAIKKPPIETASWCYRGRYPILDTRISCSSSSVTLVLPP